MVHATGHDVRDGPRPGRKPWPRLSRRPAADLPASAATLLPARIGPLAGALRQVVLLDSRPDRDRLSVAIGPGPAAPNSDRLLAWLRPGLRSLVRVPRRAGRTGAGPGAGRRSGVEDHEDVIAPVTPLLLMDHVLSLRAVGGPVRTTNNSRTGSAAPRSPTTRPEQSNSTYPAPYE